MILISSSGTSKNILNAAKYCKENRIPLITLSGFKNDNPLFQLGNVNIHVPSNKYNFIEMAHHIILVYREYTTSALAFLSLCNQIQYDQMIMTTFLSSKFRL